LHRIFIRHNKNLAVYFAGNQMLVNEKSAQNKEEKIFVSAIIMDKSGKFEIDLSDFIKMAGQYELIAETGEKEILTIESSTLILQGITTPGFTRKNEDGNCNINITAHPSGEKGTIIITGKIKNGKNFSNESINFYLKKD
jgi:hypothetical protein